MTASTISATQATNFYALYQSSTKVSATKIYETSAQPAQDTLDLGKGEPLSKEQTNALILERAFNKLRSVVDDARAELGIPEGAELDTSAEATAPDAVAWDDQARRRVLDRFADQGFDPTFTAQGVYRLERTS